MANTNPSKSDIEAVFTRLRAIQANKVRQIFTLNENIIYEYVECRLTLVYCQILCLNHQFDKNLLLIYA